MASEGEPRLCLGCPRKKYLSLVRQVSYTTTPTIETTIKLCAKLRALDLSGIPKCPHFNENETITRFFGGKKKRKRP